MAPPTGEYVHDGFYLRLGLGAGFLVSGTVHEQGVDVDISGAGPSVEIALGGTVARGLVIGGGIYGTAIPSPKYSALGVSSTGGAAVASMVGPFVDYYINPERGFHLEAALGYTAISSSKASSDPYPTEDSSGGGFGLVGGVGNEWWVGEQWSLGALGRVHYFSGTVTGSDSNEDRDVDGIVLSALLTGTLH